MSAMRGPLWREAAILILIARTQLRNSTNSQFDYKVLLLQRHAKSRFMPNFFVTPGGVIAQCDFADDWMDLYQQSFQTLGLDFSNLLNMRGPRPPIFRKSQTKVPSEIAFRICAIRETFEEAGILLLRKIPGRNNGMKSGQMDDLVRELPEREISKWRKEVHNDASQFIHLCRKLHSVPDVWLLGEWCNWLTPADMASRFDTAFFIGFVDHEPIAQHDSSEMVQTKFKSPPEILGSVVNREFKVGAPQLYDILRFCRFTKWSDLKRFQESRYKEGCSRWLPVRVKCTNGTIAFLPGDDMYPSMYNRLVQATNGELGIRDGRLPLQESQETVEEFGTNATNVHRLVHTSKRPFPILCDYPPVHGHYHPITDTEHIMKIIALNSSEHESCTSQE